MTQTDLQTQAKAHLMLHFSDMAAYAERPIPVIERGEGVHVYDDAGNRYIDGLSGLYCANLGHSYGDELGRAAHEQMRTLPFTSNWTVAHPRSIELATRIAALAPAGLDRVFFSSGGSEAVESAWKLALQYHQANGEPARRKAIARRDAYHGVTLGALSFTGIPVCRDPFEPLPIRVRHVANTNGYRHAEGDDEARFCAALIGEVEAAIAEEGPETVAMLIAEPVQNAGGSLVPPPGYWQGLREICDRHGILLCSDEVICAFGRLGEWFGADRFGYVPDLITFAKGLTGAHFPLGGVAISDKVAAPFLDGRADYMNGFTFGGHPVGCAVGLAALDVYEREGVLENVRANEPRARAALDALRDIPIVGDVRGMGHFWSIEVVRNQATREPLQGKEAEWLLKEVLSTELWQRGLICRLDDRADPIVQIAPPLVADAELFDEIAETLRAGLEVADRAARRARVRLGVLLRELRRVGDLDRTLLRSPDPQWVAERVAQAAVGPVEALGRLLGELDALGLELLVDLVDVVDGEDAGHAQRALRDQLPDLLGGGLVVDRRAGPLQEQLVLGMAGDVDREPAHEAEIGVGVHLEAELADIEVERLVLVEDVNLRMGDVLDHAGEASPRERRPLLQNCSIAASSTPWRSRPARPGGPPPAPGMRSATRPRSRGTSG